jgi:hypothetical protein
MADNVNFRGTATLTVTHDPSDDQHRGRHLGHRKFGIIAEGASNFCDPRRESGAVARREVIFQSPDGNPGALRPADITRDLLYSSPNLSVVNTQQRNHADSEHPVQSDHQDTSRTQCPEEAFPFSVKR